MINAAPEAHDYLFSHKGVDYCIGYQEQDDVLACSKRTDNKWEWVITVSYVQESFDYPETSPAHKVPIDIINEMITKVNDSIFTDAGDDGIPDNFKGEILELLLMVKNGIAYSSNGLSLK